MEIAYTVILIAGLVILAFFQNNRIKALERRVASQKEILDLLKTYLEIFDAKQLQGWIQCKQRTLEQQNDAEIEKMCSWMASLMQERFEAGHWKEREITAATDLMIRLLFYAPASVREMSIAKMPNSLYKDAVKKLLDRIPECDQFLPPAAGSGLA
jgi:hypothetical protein